VFQTVEDLMLATVTASKLVDSVFHVDQSIVHFQPVHALSITAEYQILFCPGMFLIYLVVDAHVITKSFPPILCFAPKTLKPAYGSGQN